MLYSTPFQAVINSVELYLNHDTLGKSFSLKIVQMFIAEPGLRSYPEIRCHSELQAPAGDSITYNHVRTYLDNFCRYQTQKMAQSGQYWDHALLLTGDT